VNFALFSSNATRVKVVLFREVDLHEGRVTHEVELDQVLNKTGDIWHIKLPKLDLGLLYGEQLVDVLLGRQWLIGMEGHTVFSWTAMGG
jgi:pullulanase/glycogen debranching enzyme